MEVDHGKRRVWHNIRNVKFPIIEGAECGSEVVFDNQSTAHSPQSAKINSEKLLPPQKNQEAETDIKLRTNE